MLANLKRLERRWYPRIYDLDGRIPGIFNAGLGSEDEISCEVCDVSQDGIGMITTREFDPSTQLALVMAESLVIKFRVVHCRKEKGKIGFFRIGLQRIGSDENLIELFTSHGLVKPGAKEWWS